MRSFLKLRFFLQKIILFNLKTSNNQIIIKKKQIRFTALRSVVCVCVRVI